MLAALGVVTGAALAIRLTTGLSLPLTLLVALVVVGGASAATWAGLDRAGRHEVRRRVRAGSIAGLAATAAYDLTRVAIVGVMDLPVDPFEAVPLFGQLLLSTDTSSALTDAVGIGYHVANGVGFAVAYSVAVGVRGWWAAVVWALMLEGVMLTIYPGWLDIRAVQEFFGVSALGHIAYGVVLGDLTQRILGGRAGEVEGAVR